jgi:TolB-like protein/class 3 adenylate cyclase/Tfp pilus assembly protein PilF
MSESRRLAAILAADVVGYSRKMGEDEAGTAKIVRERREAATPIVRSFGGRLVKTMGDGVLLEFPSVVAAVECAIAIQKMMVERNAAVPEAKRILYRVGVNLGDILIDGDDILGDGVNVAARLEGICEPGGVCLSSSAYEQVRGRIEAEFADLGEQTLKNIPRPVRAYALTPAAIAAVATPTLGTDKVTGPPAPKARALLSRLAVLAAVLIIGLLAAGAYTWRSGLATRLLGASVADDKLATAPRLSIVVLPFENLSGDKEQDYFADAITDDLMTDLSHLQDSFVISRGTAFTYKGKPIDAKQIGRDLGVRYLLEGSVRRVGETITINAQLISTETGAHVWADRFESERAKLGELQVEAVARLANALGVELVRAEALRATRERPSNPDAADLAMQAEAKYRLPETKANVDDAVALFDRALALDPQNPRALTELARSLYDRVLQQWSDDPAADIARGDKAVDAALAIQPDSSMAHYANSAGFVAKRQWRPAFAEVQEAIKYDRNNAKAYAWAGFLKMMLGRSEDGFEGVETAFRLSPLDANSAFGNFTCATSMPSWRNGARPSTGAAGRPPANRACGIPLSISPPRTRGPATTRRQRTPRPNCRNSIPASQFRPGPASIGPTNRPSTRNTSESPKACARRDCRRARRRRIERSKRLIGIVRRRQGAVIRFRTERAERQFCSSPAVTKLDADHLCFLPHRPFGPFHRFRVRLERAHIFKTATKTARGGPNSGSYSDSPPSAAPPAAKLELVRPPHRAADGDDADVPSPSTPSRNSRPQLTHVSRLSVAPAHLA